MNPEVAQAILDKIVGQIFGYKNPYTLEQFRQKYAFDVRLPVMVNDSITGEQTWSQSPNPTKFITLDNARKQHVGTDWVLPTKPLNSMEDILAAWEAVNYISTERQLDSLDFAQSDNVYSSQFVFRSQDIHGSKNIVFGDGVNDSEYVAASQRSKNSVYCARLEDSGECSQSFAVSWSLKIINSLFIHDSYDMFECMFCSHQRSQRFSIANMQYEEAEYYRLKKLVIQWVLTQ